MASQRLGGGAAPSAPQIVAVVLNWCNEPYTAACVESLLASRYDALTVLVVDNGSPDGSGERLHARFPHLAYLPTGSNVGYAGGNNKGIAWALENDAEYVLVLNNDTIIDPDCVGRLVAAAQETGAAVVAPRICYFDEPDLLWYGGGTFSLARAMGMHRHQDKPASHAGSRSRVTFVTGCCFLARARALRDVGTFDESYFAYVEDLELSVRLLRAGHEMVYEPAARVLHRIKRGASPTPFQIRQRDRNRRRLVKRHYNAAHRVRFALWFYPTRLVHLARYVALGQWAEAKAVVEGALAPLNPSAP